MATVPNSEVGRAENRLPFHLIRLENEKAVQVAPLCYQHC